jgi:hypothetical protein
MVDLPQEILRFKEIKVLIFEWLMISRLLQLIFLRDIGEKQRSEKRKEETKFIQLALVDP